MAPLCTICNKAKEPKFFLITCISCSKSWHHRCHNPPIPDPELIAIIKRYNEARKHNPIATLNWKCGACLKANSKTINFSDKPRQVYNTKDDPIVIDSDSDDKVTVVKKPESPKKATTRTISPSSHEVSGQITRESTGRAVRIIDDPIDFLVQPSPDSRQRSSSSSANVLTSSIGHLSVSDHQLRDRRYHSSGLLDNDGETDRLDYASPKPSPPRTKKDVRGWSASYQTPIFVPPVAETGLERSDIHKPADRRSTPNSRPSLTPQPPSLIEPPGSNIDPDVHLRSPESRSTLSPDLLRQFRAKRISFTVGTADPPGTNHQAKPEPQFHPALLPYYINSRYHNIDESTNKGDIWHSAALRNSKAKCAMAMNPDRETSASPSSASRYSRSFSARKRKTLPYGANVSVSTSMVSKDPFFFSVDVWMKEKEAALTLYEFE